jgi:hypothetical protein
MELEDLNLKNIEIPMGAPEEIDFTSVEKYQNHNAK